MNRDWTRESLFERVWWAYQCLPRDSNGTLPSMRSVEADNKLPNATLRRWIYEQKRQPTWAMARRVANALNTTADWLMEAKGKAPITSWPVEPRPLKPQPKGRRKIRPPAPPANVVPMRRKAGRR